MDNLDFVQRFEEVSVPAPIQRAPGERWTDERAAEIQHSFFERVGLSVMSHLAIQACLAERVTDFSPKEPKKHINELWLEDVQPLAFALHEAESISFGKYPLLPLTKLTLAEIEELEDLISRG